MENISYLCQRACYRNTPGTKGLGSLHDNSDAIIASNEELLPNESHVNYLYHLKRDRDHEHQNHLHSEVKVDGTV